MDHSSKGEGMQRPQGVREITQFLIYISVIFTFMGVIMPMWGLSAPQGNVSSTWLCLGVISLCIGIVNGILAIGFYRLRPWAYPIVKTEVGNWWGFGAAFALGLDKKIKSPEVQKAFGLQLISENDERANREESE